MTLYVEGSGHKWQASDPCYYDHATDQVVYTGYKATGEEPCEYCGLKYREYSLGCQAQCAVGSPATWVKRIIDGVIVEGPEA